LILTVADPMTESEVQRYNGLQLAYIGDTVWEMLVRCRMMELRLKVHHMHSECVAEVNAHAQAEHLRQILPSLRENEAEIVRRGRNAHARHPAPKNQDPDDYAAATGFEALLGYLFLTGQSGRIQELMEQLMDQKGEREQTDG